jgi:sphinganine-1-phosphate aldolase
LAGEQASQNDHLFIIIVASFFILPGLIIKISRERLYKLMSSPSPFISLPPTKQSKEIVLSAMRAARDHDLQWQNGRVFSLVYDPGDEVRDLAKEAYTLFFSENGLNPSAFPSLKKFEAEVVAMTAGLLGDAAAFGNMTSGGTESLIMAVYAAREWARAYHPEI